MITVYKTDLINRLEIVQRDLDDGNIPRADKRLAVILDELKNQTHKRSWIFCSNCGDDAKHMGRGLCAACYQYKWRTGRDRPDFSRVRYCRGCRKNAKHHGRGYCSRCYMRRFRVGKVGNVRHRTIQ